MCGRAVFSTRQKQHTNIRARTPQTRTHTHTQTQKIRIPHTYACTRLCFAAADSPSRPKHSHVHVSKYNSHVHVSKYTTRTHLIYDTRARTQAKTKHTRESESRTDNIADSSVAPRVLYRNLRGAKVRTSFSPLFRPLWSPRGSLGNAAAGQVPQRFCAACEHEQG